VSGFLNRLNLEGIADVESSIYALLADLGATPLRMVRAPAGFAVAAHCSCACQPQRADCLALQAEVRLMRVMGGYFGVCDPGQLLQRWHANC
jgi:hypothetical protein